MKSKTIKQELHHRDFRVTIFGSARIQKNDKTYKQIFALAKSIGKHGFDIVTGGGPGLMEAASSGHAAGDTRHKSDNIGLNIVLPREQHPNKYLEIVKNFRKFSGRLDNFIALSSVVVITPGGIGTCLELFYTWQLMQVKHIHPIPIIIIGEMWKKLIQWIKKYPVKEHHMSPKDLDNIYIAKDNKEAMSLILRAHKKFQEKHIYSNTSYLEK